MLWSNLSITAVESSFIGPEKNNALYQQPSISFLPILILKSLITIVSSVTKSIGRSFIVNIPINALLAQLDRASAF